MKHTITMGILAVFLLCIVITLSFSQKPQELRTRASTATTLYFSPQSSLLKPIEKKANEEFSVDVMMDPGSNTISLLRLFIEYNTTAFEGVGKDTFVINTNAFPAIMEGPIIDPENGTIVVTFSIGADRPKAIRNVTKIGKITLKAKKAVPLLTSTLVFDTRTQAFSVGPNDHAFENVIGSAEPAYIAVNDGQPTPEPEEQETPEGVTPIPTILITPTLTPTPTLIPPTYAPIQYEPTPAPGPNDTVVSFETLLHGIGNSGDNVAPDKSSFSNKDPKNTTRNVTIDILTTKNQHIITKTGLAIYDPQTGSFKGTINLGDKFVTGNYIVKIKGEGYLKKQLLGIQQIKASSRTEVSKSSLTTGDINDDNALNILDYNLLSYCFTPSSRNNICDPKTSKTSDLTDDSVIDHLDYNLFLREISSLLGK